MKTLFSIGPIHIPFFGTMIMIGVLAALGLLKYEAKRKSLNAEKVIDLGITGFLGGILGARIGYILFYNLEYYVQNPIDILKIYDGGLSIHAGIIGGTIAVLLFLKKNKDLKMLEIADFIVPPLILAQAIGRVGCDVYGKAMEIPRFWGVPIQGTIYHPAQVYEFILDYLFFLYLWRKRKKVKYNGQLFGIYVIGFAVIRSIVELFRSNPLIFGILSISHLLSIAFIIFGFLWLTFTKKISKGTAVEFENHHSLSYKDILSVVTLIVVSLIIFYGVQLSL